jgi:hypothetical protein
MAQVGNQIYIRIFKCFSFQNFNSQIQLNWLMDDRHINYITKLVKKKEKKPM